MRADVPAEPPSSPKGTESFVADAPDWLPMFVKQVCVRKTRGQMSVA
jgi:hypothetical protein